MNEDHVADDQSVYDQFLKEAGDPHDRTEE